MRPRRVSDDEILHAARACLLGHGPAIAVAVARIAEHLGEAQQSLGCACGAFFGDL